MASLAPDDEFRKRLAASIADGAQRSRQFAADHSPGERWLLPSFTIAHLGWPPKPAEEKAELAQLHAIARKRTPAQNRTAQWWAGHGMEQAWDALLAEYGRTAGPKQAKAAAKLLHDTMDMVNTATQIQKAAAARKRPFVVDPKLPLAVDRPGNNPSFPSGHTSAAVAAAIVLAYLLPGRKREIMEMANQAAYARVYGGVHFPSDVMAGSLLASTIATYMVEHARSVAGPAVPAIRMRGNKRQRPQRAA